jgi:hypothetical protein
MEKNLLGLTVCTHSLQPTSSSTSTAPSPRRDPSVDEGLVHELLQDRPDWIRA